MKKKKTEPWTQKVALAQQASYLWFRTQDQEADVPHLYHSESCSFQARVLAVPQAPGCRCCCCVAVVVPGCCWLGFVDLHAHMRVVKPCSVRSRCCREWLCTRFPACNRSRDMQVSCGPSEEVFAAQARAILWRGCAAPPFRCVVRTFSVVPARWVPPKLSSSHQIGERDCHGDLYFIPWSVSRITSGSWPRLLQKGWLVCLSSSSAASASSSSKQFGVDGRRSSKGNCENH